MLALTVITKPGHCLSVIIEDGPPIPAWPTMDSSLSKAIPTFSHFLFPDEDLAIVDELEVSFSSG
jgi:hypothetical protein